MLTLSGQARVDGVCGWPVAHSLSPRLHDYWLRHHGVDGAYVPFAVRPEDLAQALAALPALGIAGVNLTVPHKEAALACVDRLSEAAASIGAVNTIVVDPRGHLVGDNTDAFGFYHNLTASVLWWRAERHPSVVIGAGGAARAVAHALVTAGAPAVRLVNRTRARAERLAAALGPRVEAVAWEDGARTLADAGLLVNATSLGMKGQPPLVLDLSPMPQTAVVSDLVYAPLITPLLARARDRGHPIVDGLGMLLHQARPGFAAWFGIEPEVTDELRAHVLAGLG